MADGVKKNVKLSRPGTHLCDPVSGWGIGGTEVKSVPFPVPVRVATWIRAKALIETDEAETVNDIPKNANETGKIANDKTKNTRKETRRAKK